MRKLRIIPAVLALMLVLSIALGCVASTLGITSRLDDRFVRFEGPILGMTTETVVSKIGQPDDKISEDCKVPLREEGDVRFIYGDSWVYVTIDQNTIKQLKICVIKNHAVAERRRVIRQDGDFVLDTNEEIFDLKLIEDIYFGNDPSDKPLEEQTTPKLEL